MEKRPLSALEKKAVDVFGRYLGALNTHVYRATRGKVFGTLMGAPILLLTTTGRKSGAQRTSPLLYLKDGERYVIVASKGGYPTHPAWYLNLSANPKVTVEVGAEKLVMNARTANHEEKQALWPKLVALFKSYDTYQSRTDRDIPVVILERASN